jgi:hypothetical protein
MIENNKPKYQIGEKVIVEIDSRFIGGTIEEYLGEKDRYNGLISQDKVKFPVIQGYYRIISEEGRRYKQFESAIVLDPKKGK